VASYFELDVVAKLGINPGIIPISTVIAILLSGYFLNRKQTGWAFIMNVVTIVFATITVFMQLYPNVLVSSLDPAWSLTIYNSSSSAYTLRVMSIVAVIFVPIVLAYQGWTYWIFRKRLNETGENLHY
jgi:cytochrome d ubiquinol oxidase subunit II